MEGRMKGYIKLHRSMLDWEWMDDAVTVQVYVYCLLRANYEAQRWHGVIIQPGQFVTSLGNMAEDLKLTKGQLRTALNHLKATHSITQSSTHHGTLITIEKWSEYQSAGEKVAHATTRQTTSTQHRDNIDIATDKEIEEYKNNKESERDKRESPEEIPDIRLAERYDPVQYHTEEESNQMLKQAHELYAPIKARIALEAQERIKARETQA